MKKMKCSQDICSNCFPERKETSYNVYNRAVQYIYNMCNTHIVRNSLNCVELYSIYMFMNMSVHELKTDSTQTYMPKPCTLQYKFIVQVYNGKVLK